ncbi:uncharacterized protein LOC142238817 [Haematobia irritans]|uniref:uncharacterized protein LOC142238817 n=1 Tax=Haematobia irritans TaxID=7368 RepID=UPI003F501B2C
MSKLLLVFPIIASILLVYPIYAYDLAFLLDNDNVFDKCDGFDGGDIHSLADLSNLNVEIVDYDMTVTGSATLVWDVEPTDRVAFRLEILKFVRGTWQPTVFSSTKDDLCPVLYLESEAWFKPITGKIFPEDRKCLNQKGAVLRIEILNEFLKFSGTMQMEGRHKIVMHFEAFDELARKRPSEICAEIVGEFVKI